MSEGDLPAVPARTASEAARGAALGDEARALLDGDTAPGRYLDALTGRGLFPDAIRFLAHALPAREAVWWACLCAREAHGAAPPEPVAAALRAAERWVAEPDEPNRRAAEAAGLAAGAGTPAGLAALSAFWSGGSLAPAALPDVPPAAHLTPRGAAGAALLAAATGDPAEAPARSRRLLALGRGVAAGAHRWPTEPGAPPPPAAPAAPASQPTVKTTRRLDTWE